MKTLGVLGDLGGHLFRSCVDLGPARRVARPAREKARGRKKDLGVGAPLGMPRPFL